MEKTCLGILRVFFMVSIWTTCPAGSAPTQEFLIQPKAQQKKTKKLSIDELKEQIGTTAQEAFNTSTTVLSCLGDCQLHVATILQKNKTTTLSSASINQTTGAFLKHIATIQMTFSLTLEKLINNQKPFKKASRADLEHSLTCITQASVDMAAITQQLNTIALSLQKEALTSCILEKTNTSLEQQKVTLSAIDRRLSTDACLKRS
jgi:hypothetical protein